MNTFWILHNYRNLNPLIKSFKWFNVDLNTRWLSDQNKSPKTICLTIKKKNNCFFHWNFWNIVEINFKLKESFNEFKLRSIWGQFEVKFKSLSDKRLTRMGVTQSMRVTRINSHFYLLINPIWLGKFKLFWKSIFTLIKITIIFLNLKQIQVFSGLFRLFLIWFLSPYLFQNN